jgi:hypothetical protein
MTGLADPVYVEAFLQVHSFDLMLELLVVNRTNETLQNVLVELSTQVCGGCGRGEVRCETKRYLNLLLIVFVVL